MQTSFTELPNSVTDIHVCNVADSCENLLQITKLDIHVCNVADSCENLLQITKLTVDEWVSVSM